MCSMFDMMDAVKSDLICKSQVHTYLILAEAAAFS